MLIGVNFWMLIDNIDVVMANQSDLVEVVHTLKQILCVKG